MSIIIHRCPLTGEEHPEIEAVIASRKNAVRPLPYGDGKEGLVLTLAVPVEFGTKHKIKHVDIVCFSDDAIKQIVKLKLKSGSRVRVFTKRTNRGFQINEASDIEVVKAV